MTLSQTKANAPPSHALPSSAPPTAFVPKEPPQSFGVLEERALEAECRLLEEENAELMRLIEKATEELHADSLNTGADKGKEKKNTLIEDDTLDSEEKALQVLELELAFLQASLDALSSAAPLNSNERKRSKEFTTAQVDEEIRIVVEKLEKTLIWEEGRRKKEQERLTKDKILVTDAEVLNKGLRKKVEEGRGQEELTVEGLIKNARSIDEHITKECGYLMNKLVTFLDERIIGPSSTAHEDEGDVNHETKSRKKRKIYQSPIQAYFEMKRKEAARDGADPEEVGKEMKSFLEKLLNSSLTTPSPYISLVDPNTGTAIPTEIYTFFLRAGIIVPSKENEGQVRLVEFRRREEEEDGSGVAVV